MDTLITIVFTLPAVVKATLLHSLWLSSTSSKWDLKTALVIAFLRSSFDSPVKKSITDLQKAWGKDHPVKGPLWRSDATIKAPPEDDVRQKLLKTVEELSVTGKETYKIPESVDITAEWHGLRSGVKSDTPEPKELSNEAKYQKLLAETTSDAVVLYFHGGAFFIMDPSSHRGITAKLAPQIGGRVFSVRYRLAPQNPFPAALLDAVTAYLTLLHPPPGSLHKPVSASKIILAGDSAGGNLVLALTQVLLQWQRTARTGTTDADAVPVVRFHGENVAVPMPAGISPFSPWTDLTRSLPSLVENTRYDYLPAPDELSRPKADSKSSGKKSGTKLLKERHPFPQDEVWPADPLRTDLYSDGSALMHPLVSPLAMRSDGWADAPPTLFIVGREIMNDEMGLQANKMAKAGVKVRWEQWEAMPHVFGLILGELHPTTIGRAVFERWGIWARQVLSLTEGSLEAPAEGHAETDALTGVVEVAAKTFKVRELPRGFDDVTSVSDEQALELMRAAKERLCAAEPAPREA